MSIDVLITLAFPVETPEEADAIALGLTGLPPGASIHTSVSELRNDVSGVVDDGGAIITGPPPEGVPIDPGGEEEIPAASDELDG